MSDGNSDIQGHQNCSVLWNISGTGYGHAEDILQKSNNITLGFFLRSRLHWTPVRTTTLGIPLQDFSLFNISIWRGKGRHQGTFFFFTCLLRVCQAHAVLIQPWHQQSLSMPSNYPCQGLHSPTEKRWAELKHKFIQSLSSILTRKWKLTWYWKRWITFWGKRDYI